MSSIERNTIKYIDCMDEKEGLPSLPDKCIDLGFTDPPWGYFKGRTNDRKMNWNNRTLKAQDKEYYNDDFRPNWYLKWYNELIRICKGLIIVMGTSQMIWWIKNTDPIGVFILYFKNGTSQSKISKFNKYSPYLFYGDYFKKHKLHGNVVEYVIPWGFLNNENWIHPSPKGIKIPLKIFKDLKPKSIIDPFTGSGSTLKAADILRIKWLGYEINPIYKQDIDKRFGQNTIGDWL